MTAVALHPALFLLALQAARLEYNAPEKAILDNMNGTNGSRYFDRYVTEQQPLQLTTFDAPLKLWRVFGTRFTLRVTLYRCQVL